MISGLKSTERQLLLWERPLGNHGDVRCVVGDLAETLTARLVGGARHKTDSRAAYCPDVSANGTYFESKAVGRSRTAFVYGGRLDKDRVFAASHRLVYVIWHHGADSKLAATAEQLVALVLRTMRCVYVVPFGAIDRLCSTIKPDRLNSKYGGSDSRPEYGSGYRIRLSLLGRCGYGDRCVFCGAAEYVQFAHVRPTALRGSSRGKKHRCRDVVANPECYRAMCTACHRLFDKFVHDLMELARGNVVKEAPIPF
jgi:hypothetical protein